MVLNIKWRGGVGYGDIVFGLTCAHTTAIKYNTAVHIEFIWQHSKNTLYDPRDPETIVDRCNYIYDYLKPINDVKLSHTYDTVVPYNWYNNLNETNKLTYHWYSRHQPLTKPKHVALWTSLDNTHSPGFEKDPSRNKWDAIKDKLSGYVIEEITYRTPIKEALDIINRCEFGVGYDGLAHLLFKFMWKPLYVICLRKDLNHFLIPQAKIFTSPEKFLKQDLSSSLDEVKSLVKTVEQQYKDYIEDKQVIEEQFGYNLYSRWNCTF